MRLPVICRACMAARKPLSWSSLSCCSGGTVRTLPTEGLTASSPRTWALPSVKDAPPLSSSLQSVSISQRLPPLSIHATGTLAVTWMTKVSGYFRSKFTVPI